ncbi:MAG: pyrroloquinoline quinone biosynthesis peptide chaperone PqqD [Gammaproteobacteria bacterium]|nr:pyrroloquinoline quinone biosynthesis peptide chaperone PqqD [Gammaproteobacteria bacterium]
MNDKSDTSARNIISAESTPILPSHVRLHHDKVRDAWVLLAPERLLTPDETALEILRLCDGKTTVAGISLKLAEEYNAPVDEIQKDVLAMLQDLADKDFMEI